jgi:hypothetical protein
MTNEYMLYLGIQNLIGTHYENKLNDPFGNFWRCSKCDKVVVTKITNAQGEEFNQ